VSKTSGNGIQLGTDSTAVVNARLSGGVVTGSARAGVALMNAQHTTVTNMKVSGNRDGVVETQRGYDNSFANNDLSGNVHEAAVLNGKGGRTDGNIGLGDRRAR
jgi:hypothetical protein